MTMSMYRLYMSFNGRWHPSMSRALPSAELSPLYHLILPIVTIQSTCRGTVGGSGAQRLEEYVAGLLR